VCVTCRYVCMCMCVYVGICVCVTCRYVCMCVCVCVCVSHVGTYFFVLLNAQRKAGLTNTDLYLTVFHLFLLFLLDASSFV
jgi:hypothetical protein